MNLVLSEEQQLLRESARSFLQTRSPVASLRQMRDRGATWLPELWSEIVDMGWTGIAVSEELGGLDFGYVGAGQIFEQCGRTLANSPLMVSAVVAARMIDAIATGQQKASLLPQIASGELIVNLAVAEGARWHPECVATTARAIDGGYVLTGSKSQLAFAEASNRILISARVEGEEPGGLSLFLLDPEQLDGQIVSRLKVDSYSTSELVLDALRVGPECLLGETGAAWPAMGPALDIGAACSAAELLGIAAEAFERTLDYLKQREQFGCLIGSFQALQHRAAHLHCELEMTRSVVLQALQDCDLESASAPMSCSLAKAKAVQVAQLAVNEAVQMHGGIGMTDEFDIGLFLKRANAAFGEFGDYFYHADRFGRLRGY